MKTENDGRSPLITPEQQHWLSVQQMLATTGIDVSGRWLSVQQVLATKGIDMSGRWLSVQQMLATTGIDVSRRWCCKLCGLPSPHVACSGA